MRLLTLALISQLHCLPWTSAAADAAAVNSFEGIRVRYKCNPMAPLETGDLVAFYEAPQRVLGCSSKDKTPEGWHLHVVRVETTSKVVHLTVSDYDVESKGLILLVDSPTPIRWYFMEKPDGASRAAGYEIRIHASESSSVISRKRQLNSTEALESVLNGFQSSSSDLGLAKAAMEHFGAITTFSKISNANRISIKLPQGSLLPDTCDLSADNLSFDPSLQQQQQPLKSAAAVLAYRISREDVTGCLRHNANEVTVGGAAPDVYVFDLKRASEEGFVRDDVTSSEELLPVVYISMKPEAGTINRTITLVLISGHRVRWFLESRHLSGPLNVIYSRGSKVDGTSLAHLQTLSEQEQDFPRGSLNERWKLVTELTGSQTPSYLKADLANVFSMTIPSKKSVAAGSYGGRNSLSDNKARLLPDSGLIPKDVSTSAGKSVVVPSHVGRQSNAQKQKENEPWIREMEEGMSLALYKDCNQTETTVALPFSYTDRFSVVGMTLNDAECRAVKNASHWVMKIRGTSCYSVNRIRRGHPVLDNRVNLQFTPESKLHGLDVSIPFACKFPQGLDRFGSFGTDGGDDDDYSEEDDVVGDDDEDGDNGEVYKLKVYASTPQASAKAAAANSTSVLILSERKEKGSVRVGQRLRVALDLPSTAFGLSAEKCWLSERASSDQDKVNENRLLVWDGCPPTDPYSNVNNVEFVTSSTSPAFPAFAFDVTRQHLRMRKIYIFCLVGLCKADKKQPGKIDMCLSRDERCGSGPDHIKRHMSAQGQSVSRRGPIFVKPAMSGNGGGGDPFPAVVDSFDSPRDWADAGGGGGGQAAADENDGGKSPPLRSSHAVMVGVPIECAVLMTVGCSIVCSVIAVISTWMYLTRKNNTKSLRASRFHGDVDTPTEGSELQSMIASPTVASSSRCGSGGGRNDVIGCNVVAAATATTDVMA